METLLSENGDHDPRRRSACENQSWIPCISSRDSTSGSRFEARVNNFPFTTPIKV